MGTLHFIGGEKGGVGKSFVSRILSQYLIDAGKRPTGFDTDASHGTFCRFYGDYTDQVNVDDVSSLDQIIEKAENQQDANIIVDLAAQTSRRIEAWMSSCDLLGLMKELEYQVFYWHVMDDGADSTHLLEKLIHHFDDKPIQIVVVQNYGRGKSFKLFEQTKTHLVAKQKSAKFISIPKLEEGVTQKIDFGNLSFWAAANLKNPIKTAERHRVKIWINFCYEQISKALTIQPR